MITENLKEIYSKYHKNFIVGTYEENMITEEQKLEFQKVDKDQLNIELICACRYGYLDIVKYLLTSPDLKEHANINYDDDYALKYSCQHGHLELVKYLLTSSELKIHANIHVNNDLALMTACRYGHLDIVKYLLISPDLKEHADIHTGNNWSFKWSCEHGYLDIVKYFIFDYKIEKTEDIKKWIEDNNYIEISNMFDKRDLQDKELKNSNKYKIKGVKI